MIVAKIVAIQLSLEPELQWGKGAYEEIEFLVLIVPLA
jgi:hypothetical protein